MISKKKQENPLAKKYGKMIPVDQMKKSGSAKTAGSEAGSEAKTAKETGAKSGEKTAQKTDAKTVKETGAKTAKETGTKSSEKPVTKASEKTTAGSRSISLFSKNQKKENPLAAKYGKMVPADQLKKKTAQNSSAETVSQNQLQSEKSSLQKTQSQRTEESSALQTQIDLSPVLDVEELEKMIPDIEEEQKAAASPVETKVVPEETKTTPAEIKAVPEETKTTPAETKPAVAEPETVSAKPKADQASAEAENASSKEKADMRQTLDLSALNLQQKLEALADIEMIDPKTGEDGEKNYKAESKTAAGEKTGAEPESAAEEKNGTDAEKKIKADSKATAEKKTGAEPESTDEEMPKAEPESTDGESSKAEPESTDGESSKAESQKAAEEKNSEDSVAENAAEEKTGAEAENAAEMNKAAEEKAKAEPQSAAEKKTGAEPKNANGESIKAESQNAVEEKNSADSEGKAEEKIKAEPEAAADENTTAEEEKATFDAVAFKAKMQGLKKYRMYIVGGALALMVIYLGISGYYGRHFFPNSTLNGQDVSGESQKATVERFQKLLSDDYTLTLTERDGSTESISAKDIDMTADPESAIRQLLREQNDLAWPVNIFKKHVLTADLNTSYDKGMLKKAMANLDCMKDENQIMPEDAHISEYSEDKGFTIVAETEGTAIDRTKLFSGIENALQSLQTQLSLEEAGAYQEASVTSSDPSLIAAAEQMNRYCQADITLEVGEAVNEINGSVISEWLSCDENGNVTLSEEGISSYVGSLCTKYDTAWDDETLKTSYGDTITITNCHYGWLIDKDAEKQEIREEIENGETITRDLNWSMTANSHGAHDYGDSYVEINLTRQHLFLYYEGKCVIDTPIVSGNISQGNGTHTGVYGIMYCEKDATLVGENYSSPVKYWMPFNGNEGMHDASWRDKFGGSLYKYAGSHGCVNLPTSAAATIFSYVSANYPVLVYYED